MSTYYNRNGINPATGVIEVAECNHDNNYWEKPVDFPDIKELVDNDPVALQYKTCFIALLPNNFLDFDLKYLSNNVDGRFITSDGYDGASYVHQWDASKDIPIRSRQYSGVRWVKYYSNISDVTVRLSNVFVGLYGIWLRLQKGKFYRVYASEGWSSSNPSIECIDCNEINVSMWGVLVAHNCWRIQRVSDYLLKTITETSSNGVLTVGNWNYPIPMDGRKDGTLNGEFREMFRFNHIINLPAQLTAISACIYNLTQYTHDIFLPDIKVVSNSLHGLLCVRRISLPNVVSIEAATCLSKNYMLKHLDFGGRNNVVSNSFKTNVVILNLDNMPLLSGESIVNLSNALIDRTRLNTQTITIMSVVWNRLTSEEKLILPSKNYTINIV